MNQEQLTFWWAERPAKLSPSPDSAKELAIHAEDSCSPILKSLGVYGLDGLCGKMSPVFCQAGEDGTLVPSSGRWANSGTGGPTGCLTLNTAEWTDDGPRPCRKEGDGFSSLVSTLSEILEVGNLPPRFLLSARACAGILRRAERRGKQLPPMLKQALDQAACPQEPQAPSTTNSETSLD